MVDFTPPALTTKGVADLLPSRVLVKGSGGRSAPDWLNPEEENGPTRPTRAQVLGLLEQAKLDVNNSVGNIFRVRAKCFTTVEDQTEIGASWASVVYYRAAYLVELTYFPEQVKTERSAAEHYLDLYTSALEGFKEAVERACNDAGEGGSDLDGIDSTQVRYYFGD